MQTYVCGEFAEKQIRALYFMEKDYPRTRSRSSNCVRNLLFEEVLDPLRMRSRAAILQHAADVGGDVGRSDFASGHD